MTSAIRPASADAFARRRQSLMETLGDGAIILTAGHDSPRNNDVDYEFRQQSSFWYLTGFDEPDAVAVLRPGSSHPYVLFVRPYDPKFEIWVGYRAGVDGAMKKHGADAAFPIDDLAEEMPKLLEELETVYYGLGSDSVMDDLLSGLVKKRRSGAQRSGKVLLGIHDPKPAVDQMRLIKSDDEVAALREAIAVTAQGFDAAMRATKPGIHEYQVQAEMEAAFRRQGSPRNGYPSIVASGGNSCTLHYVTLQGTQVNESLHQHPRGCQVDLFEPHLGSYYRKGLALGF